MNRRTPNPTLRGGRRALVAVLLGALALVGVTAAPAAAVDPPAVDEVSIDPTNLPGSGGPVTVRARITSEADVLGASVTVVLADGNAVSDTMERESFSSEYWVGQVTVPVNFTSNQDTHQVDIFAQGVDGQTSNPRVGSIEQGAFDALPEVTGVRATPGVLSYAGGPVTISATVTDDSGVAEVYADVRVVGPGGGSTRVDLAPVGGDLYQATYTAPANPTLAVKRYSLKVSATDGGGQKVTSGSRAFSVASRVITMAPADLDFAHLVVGGTRTKSTRLTNNTTGTASVALEIPATAPYRFANGTRSTTVSIPAGATRAVAVTFAPTARGTRAAKISVTPALPDQLALTLSVIGTGINP